MNGVINRKIVWAIFCMAGSLCASAQPNDYRSFFADRLSGKSTEYVEGRKLKVKAVAKERAKVWEAWVDVNRICKEERLIPLAPISSDTKGVFAIPETLEPNARMPYYYGSKGQQPKEGYPFFLYLHGSGPKTQEWATGLKLAQYFKDEPSVYMVPQIPNEGEYYRWYQRSKQYVWNKVLRQVLANGVMNPDRLYIFGISEGGYGSQRLASFYADYLAGAGPMAGGEPLKNAPVENCMNIAFSLLTGALDKGFYRDVLTTYTRESFDSLQTLYPEHCVHRIELIPGRGHSIDYSPTTPWLKDHVRNPWPTTFLWEDFEMDGQHRSGFYNLVVKQRPDEKRTRYELQIRDNVVDLRVSNVHYTTLQKDPHWGIEMKFSRTYTPSTRGKWLIYLNEHLVDLNKKVIVRVNGKEVFNDKVTCSTAHLVNSLVEFYDPQRIYPAAVAVEL